MDKAKWSIPAAGLIAIGTMLGASDASARYRFYGRNALDSARPSYLHFEPLE